MPEPAYKRWICDACGFIYDEAKGDADSGLPPGTRYADIPDDWQCPLCGLSKSDLRLLPEPQPLSQLGSEDRPPVRGVASRGGDDHVVIIGGGIAGWSVAEAIRQRDPSIPVLLVSACDGAVYPKPALSMSLAKHKTAEDLIEKDAATRASELNIEVRTGTRVIKINPQARRLTTSSGGIRYGHLVLALGAQQRQLPVNGKAADAICRVNDLASYRKLRILLGEGTRHVTILGAGLIGCEFADDMTSAGHTVTLVDPADKPLAALLPPVLSAQLGQRLRDQGVEWHLNATLERLEKPNGRLQATLSNGEHFETDIVLSAAGLVPNTKLARKAGLAVDNGIVTDHYMRTSAADIYAIRDCASVYGRVYAFIEPIHRQAETIAARITGEEHPFRAVPPLVRVKTPSLPLAVCSPGPLDRQHWLERENTPEGCYMDLESDSGEVGFAMSGKFTRDSMALYKRLYF